MGYYLLHSHQAASSGPPKTVSSGVAGLRKQLETGTPPQRREALLGLIAARAENELTQCLASPDPTLVQLAVTGLWECWFNEEGVEARLTLENGEKAMNGGDLVAATTIFTGLMTAYPKWAEAVNKQATVLYLQGKPEESIALCQRVVALKPDHFGAWNGLVLCAIQIEDWNLALDAVQESLRLQPQSVINLQLLRLVESRLPTV